MIKIILTAANNWGGGDENRKFQAQNNLTGYQFRPIQYLQ